MPVTNRIRSLVAHPSLGFRYLRYRIGHQAPTAFGGKLKASSFSEHLTASNLALSSAELSLIRSLPSSGHMIDVGAHIGIWSIPLALFHRNSVVHAFEGSPSTFRVLATNARNNGTPNIVINQMAVSDTCGSVVFQTPRGASVFGRIAAADDADGRYAGSAESLVPSTTLDAYCSAKKISKITFLKIDTEGGEVRVLNGALSLLSRQAIDRIWFEVDPPNLPALHTIFQEYRYGIYRLSDANRPIDIRSCYDGNMLAKPF